MITKTCTCKNCKQPKKPLSEFGKNKNNLDGLQYWCKACFKEYKKDWRTNKKDNIKQYAKEWYLKNAQKEKENNKKYRDENKEKVLKIQKNWRNKNKEKIHKKAKIFRDKPENKEKFNTRQRNRRKTDINFRLLGNLRSRVNKVLNGFDKSLNTMFLIGCDIDYLMYHLQSQFTKGMSWGNYGTGFKGRREWVIDHRKPCSKFDLTDSKQQELCFNFKNLQPLWAIDNLRKSNKY